MYFLDGRSQDDVARVLGTSRSNVSRMLTAARAQGIVEIRVHGQTARAGSWSKRCASGSVWRMSGWPPSGRAWMS